MTTQRTERRDAPVSATNSAVEQATKQNDWGQTRADLLRFFERTESSSQFLGQKMATGIIVGPRK